MSYINKAKLKIKSLPSRFIEKSYNLQDSIMFKENAEKYKKQADELLLIILPIKTHIIELMEKIDQRDIFMMFKLRNMPQNCLKVIELLYFICFPFEKYTSKQQLSILMGTDLKKILISRSKIV